MRILITGGTGFVGRYIVDALADDYTIILPVRNVEKINRLYKKDNIIPIQFKENLKDIVIEQNPDIVINLLGILKEENGATFEKVHFEYSKKLIDGAKNIKIKKFIQMSALGADINSKSKYQQTKAKAEKYLIESGLDYVIFRPSIIMGKEQKLFEDFKKFAKITPIFLAPVDAKVQPVHILDVRDCYIKAVKTDIKNEIFELCGDKIINYKELFDFALRYIGIKRLVIPVPRIFFKPIAEISSILPQAPITKDQYYMLEKDNICSGKYKGVKDLLGSIRNPFSF
ncbi:complex I NDUFA9 subunit family protein [Venenivibrio stagnispumantis]|uniref:NADH dehydrogenase n=1 Tax=Venenivibrio stagnispumantis TaxID=407998 RepID=A0AA46AFD9_9AQUI|nr:complex I NDUFA9 subunit family protein [Venenivibrio stagnispumantis]MCW4573832.1 complex I NDUFA9 subunit family protein [Venenivibrio stagnispumantis]SMP18887.1 NADH dehydrogenase [Venenivibrio stagnispumantis]